jgi:hypothetical protein
VSKAIRTVTVAQQWCWSQCRKSRYHEILRSKTTVGPLAAIRSKERARMPPARSVRFQGRWGNRGR